MQLLPGHDDPELVNDGTKLLENSFVVPDAALEDLPGVRRGQADGRRLRVLLEMTHPRGHDRGWPTMRGGSYANARRTCDNPGEATDFPGRSRRLGPLSVRPPMIGALP